MSGGKVAWHRPSVGHKAARGSDDLCLSPCLGRQVGFRVTQYKKVNMQQAFSLALWRVSSSQASSTSN